MRCLVLLNSILWVAWISICVGVYSSRPSYASDVEVQMISKNQVSFDCVSGAQTAYSFQVQVDNDSGTNVGGTFYLQWTEVGTNSWKIITSTGDNDETSDTYPTGAKTTQTYGGVYSFTEGCGTEDAISIRGVWNGTGFGADFIGYSASTTILYQEPIVPPTATPVPPTSTPVPPTDTPVPTDQPSNTPTDTAVPTPTATNTFTFTAIPTVPPDPTATPTITGTLSTVITSTPTFTFTAIPTLAPTEVQPTATDIPAIPAPSISIDNLGSPNFGSSEVEYLVTIYTTGYAGNIDKYIVDSFKFGTGAGIYDPQGIIANDNIQFSLVLQKEVWDGQLIQLQVDTITSDSSQYTSRYNSLSASWWVAFPGPTNTPTHTHTPINTPTHTPTTAPTSTPNPEATTTTVPPSNTPVPTNTHTPTIVPTSTWTPTATDLPPDPEATATETHTPTAVPTATNTHTPSFTATSTFTTVPTATPDPEATATATGVNSPTPVFTPTVAPTATEPPTPTPGDTATPIPTSTPVPNTGFFAVILSDGLKLVEGVN